MLLSLNEGFSADHAEPLEYKSKTLLNSSWSFLHQYLTLKLQVTIPFKRKTGIDFLKSLTVSVPRGHDRWWPRLGALLVETTALETRQWTPRLGVDWQVVSWGEAGVSTTYHDLGWGFTSGAKWRSLFPGPQSFYWQATFFCLPVFWF